ncbi:hypothetical protein AGDE_00048 [Angomonas deanei]|nr:hypothetical protein AGDE_00048 [Angomonas deanei]|eukprot:EPY43872.1 hypothetical protein AGDE_00048 [Angomonas deanei]
MLMCVQRFNENVLIAVVSCFIADNLKAYTYHFLSSGLTVVLLVSSIMSSSTLVIGDYVVLAFHDLHDPTILHATLKQKSVDAAVIDHSYVFSSLQLCVALDRIHLGVVTPSTIASKKKKTAAPVARTVFVALSTTHNLDKVLQVLPPSKDSRSVVVILKGQNTAHVETVREVALRAGGKEHSLTPAADENREQPYAPYRSVNQILTYYGVTPAEYGYWSSNMESSRGKLTPLEACVVGKLSACDC